MMKKFMLGLAVGFVSIFTQVSALAAPLACSGTINGAAYDLSTKVSGAADCYIAMASNDKVGGKDPFTVNTEAFFGINDWTFDGRFEKNAAGLPTLATFSGSFGSDLYGGDYALNPGAAAYENIMFVFKSSDNVVAYLMNTAIGSGTYSTPFTKPPFDLKGGATRQGISHISVYYSGEGQGTPVGEVPEPATAALLGLGVLGLAALRRKRVANK